MTEQTESNSANVVITPSPAVVMVNMVATARVRVKANLSRNHLKSAIYFSETVMYLEPQLSWPPSPEDELKHRAYATYSVIAAVAALESSINELYLEAVDGNSPTLQGLEDRTIKMIAHMWPEVERQRHQILHKYETVLVIAERPKFDHGSSPYQDADSLIKLRNALIHFQPEWHDELVAHAKLERSLNGRFPDCSYMPDNIAWFPHKCLGVGCAKWSVNTVKLLMTEFCVKLGIPDRFE